MPHDWQATIIRKKDKIILYAGPFQHGQIYPKFMQTSDVQYKAGQWSAALKRLKELCDWDKLPRGITYNEFYPRDVLLREFTNDL